MQTDKLDMEAFREDALAKLKAGEGLLGANGAFTPLLKAFLEEALEGEVEQHIAEGSEPNRKNGHGKKIVRTTLGEIEIATPRDRNSTFQPKLVPKRTKGLPKDIERQIMALYARGSSLGDIRDFLEEMYDVEVSPATLSRVTDKVIPLLEEWRTRPLETVYPFVFMDADPLQGPRRGPRDQQSRLRDHRGQSGGLSRRTRLVRRRKRIGEVLDARHGRSPDPRRRGHPHRLSRQPRGLRRGHRGDLPDHRRPALRRAPDPQARRST